MNVIVVGTDPNGFGAAIEKRASTVSHIPETATKEALESADITEATLLVLTEGAEAIAIPIARDSNPGITVVVYSTEKLPDFARPSADLIVDPRLLSVDIVAEEIVNRFD